MKTQVRKNLDSYHFVQKGNSVKNNLLADKGLCERRK